MKNKGCAKCEYGRYSLRYDQCLHEKNLEKVIKYWGDDETSIMKCSERNADRDCELFEEKVEPRIDPEKEMRAAEVKRAIGHADVDSLCEAVSNQATRPWWMFWR